MEYHKIQTVFKRDEKTKRIIEGDYSLPEFKTLENVSWQWTEKVDGTNVRVYWDGKNVTFAGKTADAQMPMHLLYELQKLFEGTANKQRLKAQFGESKVCLYGEGYGFKIQKEGKNYRPDSHSFVLFDVRVGDYWLERENIEDVAKGLGLEVVPLVGTGTLLQAIEAVRGGQKSQWGDFMSEGLVLRPVTELFTRKGDRIITKIKHRDFLTNK